ncbi:MAG: HD domain-containing protein [Treponema sp.]|nr:HD domain-containing protein [Treponema sp.]
MKEFLVKEIASNSFFTKTVYLEPPKQSFSRGDQTEAPPPNHSFVITVPEIPFTKNMYKTMDKWGFTTVVSEGEPRNEYTHNVPSGELNDSLIKDISQQSDLDKVEKAEKFYTGFLQYVEDLFVRANVSDELDFADVTKKIRDMLEYIKEDRRFLMRVIKTVEHAPGKNYLASHSVRSAILAIIIGTYLKLPNHRLIELGTAALLHEVGMLKLPSNIYLSKRTLSDHERKAIVSHPIFGYSMLKSFNFPLAVCLAALEHHERENGSGYPRQLSGEKIGLYSKIIAVTCSYEALGSSRPHKEAKDGYTGMLELLKNEGKQYDDTIVRALVLSLSIYPIGLYVLLSNDKKGQVVDVNPENPRFPIVQIFGEFTPDGKIKTAQTAQDELTIVRPLTRSEIES